MRSRYTAYAMGLVDYVMDTTAAGSPHRVSDRAAWAADLLPFCEQTRFAGLSIVEAPAPQGDEAFVTFRAELYAGGRDASFTERSRFVREGERWMYDQGV